MPYKGRIYRKRGKRSRSMKLFIARQREKTSNAPDETSEDIFNRLLEQTR